MTEKRSQYRQKHQHQKTNSIKGLFNKAKQRVASTQIDQNSDDQQEQEVNNTRQAEKDLNKKELAEEKANRLKRRLNWAIIGVLLLLIIVLVALFKL